MPVADLKFITSDRREGRINADTPLPVAVVPGGAGSGDWELYTHLDAAVNDNDKTFAVPATQEWQLLWIYVAYTSDANAGNRQLQVNFITGGGVVFGQVRPNAAQAASLTRHYMIAPSLANQLAFYDTDHLQAPLPPTTFLQSNFQVRVYDNNGVSPLDDMIVALHMARREA